MISYSRPGVTQCGSPVCRHCGLKQKKVTRQGDSKECVVKRKQCMVGYHVSTSESLCPSSDPGMQGGETSLGVRLSGLDFLEVQEVHAWCWCWKGSPRSRVG